MAEIKIPIVIDGAKTIEGLANRALDEYSYKGRTIREWADLIACADVVEAVVRCKDCVFWECPNAPTHNRHMCSYWEVGTYDYDFCSDGERRSE